MAGVGEGALRAVLFDQGKQFSAGPLGGTAAWGSSCAVARMACSLHRAAWAAVAWAWPLMACEL